MRKETPWGVWDHIPLEALVAELQGFEAAWWVAGGYAIDAFAGFGRRPHDDLDFGIFAQAHLALREHLAGWELHYADPPGRLEHWKDQVALPDHVHDIWVRRDSSDAWRFQAMLNPCGPDEFIYRRDHRVRMPLEQATFLADGVRYLVPEVQLLFKSRAPRDKDEQDFSDCLPLLSAVQRRWLRETIARAEPTSPWLQRF